MRVMIQPITPHHSRLGHRHVQEPPLRLVLRLKHMSCRTVHGQVAASTQNVALQALVFLYRAVLKQDFPELGEIERIKRSRHVPVVFTRVEMELVCA